MGFLAIREGKTDEALKWYSEAVKLDSQSYLAHYYFAVLSMQAGGTDEDKEIEASLRASMRLNPRFAPSYERLATFFGMRHENLDEARSLALQAIKLDPANLNTRMNAANVYTTANHFEDAATILRSASKLAKTPGEEAMVQDRIDQLTRYKAAREQAQARATTVDALMGQTIITTKETGPKHPTESTDGPKHEALGVIRGVKCSYPSVMEFSVEGAKKNVSLYSNNYSKLDFTALNFTPQGTLNPCSDIEGMKARVQYAESSDKTVDGQAIAIELRK
jgi:tetratricopeptide (TPR) repeat protein